MAFFQIQWAAWLPLREMLTLAVSATTFLLVHLIQNKGIAFAPKAVAEEEDSLSIHERVVQIRKAEAKKQPFLLKLQNGLWWLPTPGRILRWSKDKVHRYGTSHMLLGSFLTLYFALPVYVNSYKYQNIAPAIPYMHFLGMILAALLIIKEEWPKWALPYFAPFWYGTILYCFPILNTFFFLLNNGSSGWEQAVGMTIFFLIALVDWSTFLVLAPLGATLGTLLYWGLVGMPSLHLPATAWYFLGQQLIIPTLIGGLFARKQQMRTNQGVERAKVFAAAMGHEIRGVLYSKSSGECIKTILGRGKLGTKEVEPLKKIEEGGKSYFLLEERSAEVLLDIANNLQAIGQDQINVTDRFLNFLLKGDVTNLPLSPLNGHEAVSKAIEYTEIYYPREKIRLINEVAKEFTFKGDQGLFNHVICNLAANAHMHGGATEVRLFVDKQNHLHVRDNGKGVPQEALPHLFDFGYRSSSKVGFGVGLSFCKHVINAFGGEISCDAQQGANSYTDYRIELVMRND
jgi:two-component system CAI-1 autoinducer sensor kinase/phosphatase CqsS